MRDRESIRIAQHEPALGVNPNLGTGFSNEAPGCSTLADGVARWWRRCCWHYAMATACCCSRWLSHQLPLEKAARQHSPMDAICTQRTVHIDRILSCKGPVLPLRSVSCHECCCERNRQSYLKSLPSCGLDRSRIRKQSWLRPFARLYRPTVEYHCAMHLDFELTRTNLR